MKKAFTLFIALFLSFSLFADEGMWLPSQIHKRIADMQAKGFKLSAEDIYSINQPSLKDAVVHFNGGCTGELISDQGLLITNYHCGYGQIQAHSSVEHDYLRDGFWAMTIDEELPNERIYVRFLVRMDDVTEQVLKGYDEKMSEAEREALVAANSKPIIEAANKEGVGYTSRITPLYYGNQYFIFVYQEFTDVRLVGAPPTAVGKFGGDTDNWMWPRHTGDFSLFRIYADKDNNPAPYSKDNVPYKPKKHFKMSVKGINENDFTFVYGFPGRTQEYIYSEAVRYISETSNPHKHELRTKILNIYEKYMSQDQAVRIKYSSKHASVANAWKKWEGEMKGIIKMKAVENKRSFEEKFREWAADKPQYESVLPRLAYLYDKLYDYAFAMDYYNESIRANEIVGFARNITNAVKGGTTVEKADALIDGYFKNYHLPIDKEVFTTLLGEYVKNMPEHSYPEYLVAKMKELGSVEGVVEEIFAHSALTTAEVSKAFVRKALNAADPMAEIMNDPAVKFYNEFADHHDRIAINPYNDYNREINLVYRQYMRGQMEFRKDKVFFPDANSTLRVAYGKVQGYSPADAVYYTPVSTIEGIMQKDNPEIFDYNIPQKLRDIYAAKDYGKWGANGSVPVCFIATNHTSGGNSGSPVIDADGNLIGINFDRVWEGTMSDIVFDPDLCRNISLDMRYVLFTIDKVAGAQRLLDEIEVVE